MKTIILIVTSVILAATITEAKTYSKPYPFDLHGCKRHLKAIVEAVKDAGGTVVENDDMDRSFRVTLNGKTTIYSCTRHELLETEIN